VILDAKCKPVPGVPLYLSRRLTMQFAPADLPRPIEATGYSLRAAPRIYRDTDVYRVWYSIVSTGEKNVTVQPPCTIL
jgi:hypothetical protein